jgi:hypothetical protein
VVLGCIFVSDSRSHTSDWTLADGPWADMQFWQCRFVELRGPIVLAVNQVIVVLVHVCDVLLQDLLVLVGIENRHAYRRK